MVFSLNDCPGFYLTYIFTDKMYSSASFGNVFFDIVYIAIFVIYFQLLHILQHNTLYIVRTIKCYCILYIVSITVYMCTCSCNFVFCWYVQRLSIYSG